MTLLINGIKNYLSATELGFNFTQYTYYFFQETGNPKENDERASGYH